MSNTIIEFLSSLSVTFILSWIFLYMFLFLLALIATNPFTMFVICGGLAMYVDYKIQHKYVPKVQKAWLRTKQFFSNTTVEPV